MRVIWRLFTSNTIFKNLGIVGISTLVITTLVSLLIGFSFPTFMLSFISTQLFGLVWKNRYDRVRTLRIGVRTTHIIIIVCSLLIILFDLTKIDKELTFTLTLFSLIFVTLFIQGFIISHYNSVTSPHRRPFYDSMNTSSSISINRRSTSHKRTNLMFFAIDENDRARSEGRPEPFPGWDKEKLYYGGWDSFVNLYDNPNYSLNGDDFPDDEDGTNMKLFKEAKKKGVI